MYVYPIELVSGFFTARTFSGMKKLFVQNILTNYVSILKFSKMLCSFQDCMSKPLVHLFSFV